LTDGVIPLLHRVRSDRPSRDLLAASAVLCEVIGWMSYDLGRHAFAQRYLTQAIRLAKAAGDPIFAAYVITSLADQALFLGHIDHALRLTRVAEATAGSSEVPILSTESAIFRARAYAARRDHRECIAALADAERAYEQLGAELPDWANAWTSDVLASHVGTCWVELHNPVEADRWLTPLLGSPPSQVRRRIYTTVQSARSCDLHGNIDEASTLAGQAIQALATTPSSRSLEHVRRLVAQLHRSQPGEARVIELIDRLRAARAG
jgi:tetratricopeptide (TPR) repeat protein